MFVKYELSYN